MSAITVVNVASLPRLTGNDNSVVVLSSIWTAVPWSKVQQWANLSILGYSSAKKRYIKNTSDWGNVFPHERKGQPLKYYTVFTALRYSAFTHDRDFFMKSLQTLHDALIANGVKTFKYYTSPAPGHCHKSELSLFNEFFSDKEFTIEIVILP